jgi:hypothetical protein
MAEAKTRVSTPRKTASNTTMSVINMSEDREADIARRRSRHAEIYLKMDDPLHDAAKMAEVISTIINATSPSAELTDWAVNHLVDMVIALRWLYDDDEPADGAA